MMGNESARFSWKHELWQQLEALDVQQALFPSPEPKIDEIVQQLENINPIPNPLSVNHLADLRGDWQLVYASRGTVITRPLASVADVWGGIKIKRVWQRLITGDTGNISATNGAELELPLLGDWQLWTEGFWSWGDDEQMAKVSFHSFAVQAIKPFGISSLSLPPLKIPVLEFLRQEAVWITSYLDEDIRVGRGATGNLFVFRRMM
ncbi:PAP_fibrillin [Nostoc sp. PCC 7524]|uniref:PAP/fibrillin family protein n=1 Tax=Nostoc sp. (strain ATCC 29411 / PCC 7524) TaxID=28072 RepID=UPI00029F20DD|nr:PAP/fibrillin family protein [Nostoc sp. PCC 7524]AFY49169.1 PAP_fibrillin [Nostoc sp. PCC 7524]